MQKQPVTIKSVIFLFESPHAPSSECVQVIIFTLKYKANKGFVGF